MYQNPAHISAFQKKKVREIAEGFAKENRSPLRNTVSDAGVGYRYTMVDIRNYYESVQHGFDLIVR